MNEVYIACSRFYCGWMDEKGINERVCFHYERETLCAWYNINIEAYNSQSVLLNTVFLVIIVNNSKLFVKDIYFIHRCVYRNIRYSSVLILFEVFYQFENNGSTNDLFKTHLSI